MRVLVAILALSPALAAAQGFPGAQDLGTYQITSGTSGGEVYGTGFTGELYAAPELLSQPVESNFHGGNPPLSFCFGCGLPGPDDGDGVLTVTGLNNPSLAGLVQLSGFEGYLETGELAVSPTMDVTGAGTYSAPFTMSVDLAYGLPHTNVPEDYVNFVGFGTVTLDVAPAQCPNGPSGRCGPLQISSLNYTFAPELDPGSLGGALLLLGGGLLVLRGRQIKD